MASSPISGTGFRWLTAPVSIAPLVTFRVLFGLLMLGSTIRFWALGWIEDHFILPKVHFHYFGFEWVEPLPGWGMYLIHALMIVGSLGIMLGAWYRFSAALFALCFLYTELIDITWYLNHYYFVSLVSFLLIFLPAQRSLSIDAWRKPEIASEMVPRYTILLLQLQLAMVYIFAGLAKLNTDWLIVALPLRIWLPAHGDLPLLGWAFSYEITAYLFSWGGMLYDSLIPFFLWWGKTRPWAYVLVIVFHLMTGILFQIGVFPVVMILLTTIFFSGEWHRRIQDKLLNVGGRIRPQPAIRHSSAATHKLALGLIYGYLLIQLLFPWRYLLYEGNVFWNEEGYRFAWRVMLVEKAGTATFYVTDPVTGREGVVDNRAFLNAHQEKQLSFQPDLILQFAHFLADHYQQAHQPRPSVRAEVFVTMNGRPSQPFIDPSVNLAAISDGWQQKTWVLPYPFSVSAFAHE